MKVFTQTNNLFQETLTSYEVFYMDIQTIPREGDLWSSICDVFNRLKNLTMLVSDFMKWSFVVDKDDLL